MIIDTDTSFGPTVGRGPDLALPTLLRELRRHDIELACTCSRQGAAYDQCEGNRETIAVARQHPHLLPVATLNPRRHTGWERDLEEAQAQGAVAFRFFPQEQGWNVDSLPFRAMLRRLAKSQTPIILTAGPWSWGVVEAIARATAESGVPVVILDVQYSNLAEAIEVMRVFPDVLAGTQRLTTPGAVAILAREIGADRLLFGSGAPFRPIQPALNMVLAAEITPEEKAAILGGNARRVFRLPSVSTGGQLPLARYPGGPIVDVHTHISEWNFPVEGGAGPEDLEDCMRQVGITTAICSHGLALLYDLGEGNRRLQEALRGHPSILGYIVLNPHRAADSRRELERYTSDPNFVGVKIHNQIAAIPTGAPETAALFGMASEWGRPVLIHACGSTWPADLCRLAREHPRLAIISAHGFEHVLHSPNEVIEAVAGASNIYLEFANSYPERHAIRLALETLGPERVLFGSDQNLIDPRYVLGSYHDAELSPREAGLVLSENARRIFHLS